ncbi:Tm-1-like ATP-binding domain-containing protein [Bradyrhizobium ottawaense]|uniref:Tm-1-like ATP-binding domain-containing protein n=1 Tax=Bradyrhizobium ottawaense TaxID=931866 RepID=UPI00384D5487
MAAIVATLDTKGRETAYLARVIEQWGRKTLTIDVGTSNRRNSSDARVVSTRRGLAGNSCKRA